MNLRNSHATKKSWRALLVLLLISTCASTFSGCATKAKTYRAPDAAKMTAARAKLSGDVDRARASAKKVREHVGAAQASAGRVTKFSGTTSVKLGKLHGRVTPELRPAVEDIQADVAAVKLEEAFLTGKLSQAIVAETVLDRELNQAQNDKAQLSSESVAYAQKAEGLAQSATDENAARIKAEKALSWYRWHSWLLKIGAGVFILVILGVVFLWFTGRLAGLASRFV